MTKETRLVFFTVFVITLSQINIATTTASHWGTFRPHTFISARAAVPHSPYFGFVYHPANNVDVRHIVADAKNQIHSFSWSRHDGSQFGDQHIRDHDANLLITSTFVAHHSGSACSIRVSAAPLDPNRPVTVTSLIMYAAVAPDEITQVPADVGTISFVNDVPSSSHHHIRINGSSSAIGGEFSIRVNAPSFGFVDSQSFEIREKDTILSTEGTGSRSCLRNRSQRPGTIPDEFGHFQVSADKPNPRSSWAIDSIVRRKLSRTLDTSPALSNIRLLDSKIPKGSSVLFVQRLVQAPFQIEVSLVVTEGLTPEQVSTIEGELMGSNLDNRLDTLRKGFDDKFERIFSLSHRFSNSAIDFAKQALSNVLGGIGYFYGSTLIKNDNSRSDTPDALPAVGLLTATPSRDVFPRGFLWDEGFHQLIIQQWDPLLSMRCLSSWFRVSQPNGWIPREQILGVEARERFPVHVRHLIVQNPTVANPPTILMPLPLLWEDMRNTNSEIGNINETKEYWKVVSDEFMIRAEKYYKWLKNSQSGSLPHSFRWRGRSTNVKSPDGYPLTLSSGLDDYPRALTVSDEERHVDLHSWITWAARVLAQVCEVGGCDASEYQEDYKIFKSSLLNHHSIQTRPEDRQDLLLCDYDGSHRICHEGYATILPLILGLLDSDDERVSAILDALEDRSILRAKAGVMSLSKSDRWHRKGDDYWTGSVWMPFNFLTLAALKTKYGRENGLYRERALKIYNSLRDDIVENTMEVFEETGQLWENYSPDVDGSGKSGRQFTGWTALVLLIMSEKFVSV